MQTHENNDFFHTVMDVRLAAAKVFLEDLLFRGAGSADANFSDHLLLRILSQIISECEAIGKNTVRYTKHQKLAFNNVDCSHHVTPEGACSHFHIFTNLTIALLPSSRSGTG